MSLAEIKIPAAKNNPINKFYANSLDVKTLIADSVVIPIITGNLEVTGDLKVDGKETVVGFTQLADLGVSGGQIIENPSAQLSIINSSVNTNRATLELAGRYPTVASMFVQETETGAGIIELKQSNVNLSLITAGTGNINLQTVGTGVVNIRNPFISTATAVTQLTSPTTDVTINSPNGVITTFALTTAADVGFDFKVINSFITTNTFPIVSISNYSVADSTGQAPYVFVRSHTTGSCILRVVNVGTASLTAAVSISFLVMGM